ncbi:MAG: hypothetical protein LUE99_00340 [Bacteroides sp.]|nr:hypothetical protein [Bacteroides sp.]
MKTSLFLLAIGLFSCLSASKAQNTPLPSETKFLRHEVSVSYGFLPNTDAGSIAEEWLFPVASFGVYKRESTHYYGALNVSYTYRFNRKISLGVVGGLTGNKGRQGSFYEQLDTKLKDNRTYLYVLPTFRYHWFARPNFSLYSSVGLGANFLFNTIGNETYRKTELAYQVSFLGIEYGKRFAIFTEFGIGHAGAILLGGRYRF